MERYNKNRYTEKNTQYTAFKRDVEGWQLGLGQVNFGDDAEKLSVKTSSTKSSAFALAAKLEQERKQAELTRRAAAMKKCLKIAQEEEQKTEEELTGC